MRTRRRRRRRTRRRRRRRKRRKERSFNVGGVRRSQSPPYLPGFEQQRQLELRRRVPAVGGLLEPHLRAARAEVASPFFSSYSRYVKGAYTRSDHSSA